MGKKTFEEIGKILLVSIISILISVQTTRRVLLDKKLNRSEFLEYKGEHTRKHDSEHDDLKEIKGMVLWLYKNEIKKENE